MTHQSDYTFADEIPEKGLEAIPELMRVLINSAMNYGAILSAAGVFTTVQTEIYITLLCAIVIGAALWLRWHERPTEPAAELPHEAGSPA